MKYPNNIKRSYNAFVSYANRGMDLESYIDEANKYYLEQDIAIVYKKPTPIAVVKQEGKKITNAYFKEQSTLDYVGIYKGHYIEFDAKVTKNKTSFPLSNIHDHQIKHIQKIINHNGMAFIIISMNSKYFLLDGNTLINFINNFERKSIPYEYIVNNSFEIFYNYNKGLDYINKVNIILEDKYEIKNT